MTYSEQAIDFCCEHDTLVGVLGVPESAASLGVVVVVGGPQYRAGSHRQFVLLCRALAAAGIATLRFDYRGMGDKRGRAAGERHRVRGAEFAACSCKRRQHRNDFSPILTSDMKIPSTATNWQHSQNCATNLRDEGQCASRCA